MSGKIFFKLNEKLLEGKTFEIIVDNINIGQISKNSDTIIYQAQQLKNYYVTVKGNNIQKSLTVNLSEKTTEQTLEIITNKENNKFYLYILFIILYIAIIVACYFILNIEIYYVLILMVLALPIVITKLLNNSSDSQFKLKIIK